MGEKYVKLPPVLFPGEGSLMETEIRRVEFDMERSVRPVRKERGYER